MVPDLKAETTREPLAPCHHGIHGFIFVISPHTVYLHVFEVRLQELWGYYRSLIALRYVSVLCLLEIYNERVHDLLSGEVPLPPCHSLPRRRGNARKDLRVREHPSRGPYVQNLRRVLVQDVEALLSLVAEGTRRRRTAATRRNSTSSRSHALLEITTPHATLHLADLAGSEKASWEGCGGGRQKEGANINKSLVALSNVISALVNGGSARGKFVPYRDSALTWLLKDCFTGGASTFIIATVSPSVVCYGESASTLRWAARARQLPTPRNVSCGSHVATRAALQAQLNQLISELSRNHIRYVPETGKILFDEEHWAPRTTENENLNKAAIIGNIMNIARLKPDATNSESTASSVASGSSDVINAVDKNSTIASEINKEMDKLFGPALERASSGDDFKVIAPLRHKKRQFRSQEVLANEDMPTVSQSSNLVTTLPSQSEASINEAPNTDKTKVPPITILHDNQRAEIVASVTERLYTKLKKKEEAAVSKVESMVDRKIMEPLSELKICTNARQRLMELSQKAIRNKRRIGIPAHTQTRITVTRVKDQAVDVQTDLYSYVPRNRHPYAFCRDVATETVPMTPRCKEIAVGPTGSLDSSDMSTETKRVNYKNSYVMTDIVTKNERCTQTIIVPPPRRRKRSAASKHICCKENHNLSEECISAPVISINISQVYPVDTESQSSDDNSEKLNVNSKSSVVTSTPDLLTNHNTIDPQNVIDIKEDEICVLVNVADERKVPIIIQDDDNGKSIDSVKHYEEFPDTEDFTLPRVNPNSVKSNSSEIKNMILGRNQNMYPYNIILSPPKERDSKRIVTFKENHADKTNDTASGSRNVDETNDSTTNRHESTSDMTTSDKDIPLEKDFESVYSDSTDSSKVDTDSFIWKQGSSRTMGCLKKNYVPVYKSSKYKTAKGRGYKDVLGLESEGHQLGLNSYETRENIRDVSSSDSRDTDNSSEYKSRRCKPYFENKSYYNPGREYSDDVNDYHSLERKLIDSCNNLEESVNRYENYVSSYKQGMKIDGVESTTRRPKEYLQHLVQLRREPVLSIHDPDIAKLLLIKDFDSFQSRGTYAGGVGDPLAANLFNIFGKRWKTLRLKMTPTFTPGKLKTMYPIVEDIAKQALNYVDVLHSNEETVNFTDFYSKYAMEIIGNVGFGVECNGFVNPNSEFYIRGHEYFDHQSHYWRLIRAFAFFAPDTFDSLKIRRISSKIENFFCGIVKRTVEYRQKHSVTRNDFLQTLIELKNGHVVDEQGDVKYSKTNFPFTMTDVAANTMLYMIAGYETSATTGQFAAYQLALNPHIQARVRKEVDTVLAKYGGECTYEAQNEMVYLNMVLDETMRMHPSMRALFRRCNKDYKLPNSDLVIEKGTMVFIPIHAIHMDPDIFPEPEKFDPERFSPENKAKLHPCHWMPFGEGPKKCLGIRQGYIQSKMALIKVLHKYELILDKRTEVPMKIKNSSLVYAAQGGVWLKLRSLEPEKTNV
ncbi:hypothetical protein HF086_014127 [Spodoptera exigua]|uniref:unspecific monooxygenase n=1 Tax=Spodoptera exigua TaxID=7107 RepID=A0A922MM84_SPOEX|nr:hypothetical protein HF086_014127 [Spodoptera exigua]